MRTSLSAVAAVLCGTLLCAAHSQVSIEAATKGRELLAAGARRQQDAPWASSLRLR